MSMERLLARMEKQRVSLRDLAEWLEISKSSLEGKVHDKTSFTVGEMVKTMDLLKIDVEEFESYFFTSSCELKQESRGDF